MTNEIENYKSKEKEKKFKGMMDEALSRVTPKQSCNKCYGRGFCGWSSPVIPKNHLPKDYKDKDFKSKGEKITCSCVINRAKKEVTRILENENKNEESKDSQQHSEDSKG